MKEVKIERDVPVGILLILISQFFVYAVIHLAKFPSALEFFGIMVFLEIAGNLISLGLKYVFGGKIVKPE